MTLLQRGRDKLLNGVILGALLGLAIWQGATVYTWLLLTIPTAWLVLGDLSLPIYLIGACALIGYIIDRV